MTDIATNSEKRDSFRKRCRPRSIDVCSLGTNMTFFSLTVLDESQYGMGCAGEGEAPPSIGTRLDWCGLKRFTVKWVRKLGSQNKFQVGLVSD
ncbi:MAG: hypothetical protein HQL32_06090 [Planctomycetes bacterium]|nr:hypothetical protein [Planctomycetota bacterium]